MNQEPASRRSAGAASGGFTLIELMTVVIVIAVLAAIAIPSYRAYAIRSHRTAAKGCLAQLSNYMERYYATNMRYDQDMSAPPVHMSNTAFPQLDCTAHTPTYTFSFASAGATFTGITTAMPVTAPNPNPGQAAYVLQAVPAGAQAADTQCKTLALDQTGAQGISTSATGTVQTCWQR